MTDHPIPATPEATEREARENIAERVGNRWAERITEFSTSGTVKYPRQSLDEALDAYAAAVRARALADVAGWVEGMRVAQPFVDCPFCTQLHSCANGHYVLSHNVLAYNAALDAVRAKLREAK